MTAQEQLREALEPFARYAEFAIGETEDDGDRVLTLNKFEAGKRAITVGDFRRAVAALSQPSTPPDVKRLRELLAAATPVTDADLIRYAHGGGRWAMLRDGERELVADFYNEADRETHVAAWLALPAFLDSLEMPAQGEVGELVERLKSSLAVREHLSKENWDSPAGGREG